MRISVECGGFDEAADACRTANQTTALLAESLSGKLLGFGGMAGDDASSADFASSYDAAAAEAVGSLGDLTHAFIGLGRLLSATGANHATAEAAAAQVVGYSGRGLTDDAFVRVHLSTPPSSLGADEPALGVVDRWILDRVEGFVWPGADVALLREAAHAWTSAGSSVGLLVDQVDVASSFVERQRSAEIPAALASLAEVRSSVGDVATELASLGAACEHYADTVEEVHARTRDLLAEIAQMVVEDAAISAIVGGLTGGLGGSATVAAAVAHVRAQAPRFHALLVGLRAAAVTTGSRLRTAREALRGLRARFDRYARVAVRDERGEMLLPGGWRTTVRAQDALGGHILERHVGKSIEELAARAGTQRLALASSFDDVASAEAHIASALARSQGEIAEWLAGGDRQLRINAQLGQITGICVTPTGASQLVEGVRIILVRAGESSSGYRILTAFPQP